MTTQQLRALDRQHLWHPFTPMSLWAESEALVNAEADLMEGRETAILARLGIADPYA